MNDSLINESYLTQLRQGLLRALSFGAVLSGALLLCLLTERPLVAVAGVFSFFVGAVLGDFLNHLCYRLRSGIPVLGPANHCPNCLITIKGIHNVPIIGWLLVRGQCRFCGVPIPIRYLLAGVCGGVSIGATGLFLVMLWQSNP